MCGRAYETYTSEELAMRYRNHKPVAIPEFEFNYNLAPTQLAPVLRLREDGQASIDLLRWGLIPPWAKDLRAGGYSMINARSEEVMEKRTFKGPFQKRRAILPISGFFEWKREGKTKTPYRIYSEELPILSVAGFWEKATIEGKPVESFAVLTTRANAVMSEIHDRMPVLLRPEDEHLYLTGSPEEALALLKPCPDSWLKTLPVSKLVNSPRNNRPEVLEPVPSGTKNPNNPDY